MNDHHIPECVYVNVIVIPVFFHAAYRTLVQRCPALPVSKPLWSLTIAQGSRVETQQSWHCQYAL